MLENSYNLNDIDVIEGNYVQTADEYEFVTDDVPHDDVPYETGRRVRAWYLLALLIIVVLAAIFVVYGVMPFVASFMTTSAAADLLPNAVQA